MGRGKNSLIWKHFEPDPVELDKARCKLCDEKISRGSKDPQKQTTSTIKRHLERVHVKEFNELFPSNKNTENTEENNESENAPKIKISKLRTQADRKELLKGTIPGWVESKNKLAFDSVRAKAIHNLIFEMSILDFQPYSIVNDAGFIRLLNYLEPRYEIPSDKYVITLLNYSVFLII